MQNLQQDLHLVFIDAFGSRGTCQVGEVLNLFEILREQLLNEVDDQVDGLLLDRGVDGVVKDGLHDLLDQFFDIKETLCYFLAVLLHGTVGDCPYTEYIDGKDIIDKDIGLDNLNPVRTNGIL